jgi:ABC-type sugar transport system ATPase subunit
MNALQIKNLYMQYRYGALALQNINLEVEQGKICTILSLSEGGKTSLIKGIAGLYPISRGEIILKDRILNNLPIKDRNLTIMYEDGCLFKGRTVLYNLLYPQKIRKVNKIEALDIASRLIDEFDLIEYKDIKVRKLNNETKFKLAIARLFLRVSDLYLIDDPLKVFENEDRAKQFEYFHPYLVKLSKLAPVVYATSNVKDCLILSENVSLLNYGVQLQSGNINEIITHPNNVTSYSLFHEGMISDKVKLVKSSEDIYLELDNKKIFINENNLLNDIYIDSEVLACYLTGDNGIDISTLRLFDINSEKLIYFN